MPTSTTTASSSTVPQVPAAINSQWTGESEGESEGELAARGSVRMCVCVGGGRGGNEAQCAAMTWTF